jgi:hypothetical protein
MFCDVGCYLLTDVSGQHSNHIFQDQAVQKNDSVLSSREIISVHSEFSVLSFGLGFQLFCNFYVIYASRKNINKNILVMLTGSA